MNVSAQEDTDFYSPLICSVLMHFNRLFSSFQMRPLPFARAASICIRGTHTCMISLSSFHEVCQLQTMSLYVSHKPRLCRRLRRAFYPGAVYKTDRFLDTSCNFIPSSRSVHLEWLSLYYALNSIWLLFEWSHFSLPNTFCYSILEPFLLRSFPVFLDNFIWSWPFCKYSKIRCGGVEPKCSVEHWGQFPYINAMTW